ncbi:hypothetical protein L3Q82_014809 [Scortum barcoo]|uniref:Uncharacterized protein n=1 Tax=Scortum barcoo TaxID=214431 RepID=A0ACB8VSI1_9TELE|nr:hypothetical protein L3Q82_014809 [Scortum barcoo]
MSPHVGGETATPTPELADVRLQKGQPPQSTRTWQYPRPGSNTSSLLILNTGAPQGCVFSPLLYSLYTYDCAAKQSSNVIFKFADDTTILGLITDNEETAFMDERAASQADSPRVFAAVCAHAQCVLSADSHQRQRRRSAGSEGTWIPSEKSERCGQGVSLVLGLLILTAGIASLSVVYSTPHKIESFGEGDLFFVDTQAVSFNRGLHLSTAAGIGLSCLGSAMTAMGVVVWILPRANLKERLFHRPGEGEGRGESGSKWRGFRVPGDVVTKSPAIEEGKIPITLSKVENVQPTS